MVLMAIDRLQLYEDLKPAEKYFFLLETFWTDTDWVDLQAGYFGVSPFRKINTILMYLGEMTPGKKIRLRDEMQDDMRMLIYELEYFFHYFSYFGFWEVTPYKVFPAFDYLDRAFAAESITPTFFGVTLAPLLKEERDILEWNLPHRRRLGDYKPIPGSPVPEDIYALITLGQKRKNLDMTSK
jgi:hypothetical protein